MVQPVLDMGTVVRELRKDVEEANAVRVQRYQKPFPGDPSIPGVLISAL